MKKIVNIFVLIVVCLLPTIVDAKANFELKNEYLNEMFLYEEDGKNYFYNGLFGTYENGSLKIYDYDKNLLEEGFIVDEYESISELYSHRVVLEYLNNMYIYNRLGTVIKCESELYGFNFSDGYVNVFKLDDDSNETIYFEDDDTLIKKYFGKGYDIYLDILDRGYIVYNIRKFDDYYIVDYNVSEYEDHTAIIDGNLNVILDFKLDYNKYQAVHIYDNLIYVMKTNKVLELYKMDGTKLQTYNIVSENIDNASGTHCNYDSPYFLKIVNNRLYIVYGNGRYGCEERRNYSDASEVVGMLINDFITLEYELDFDVNKIESSKGEFTYESKKDENGKSYVELKIEPKEGYSVEDIIVTDVNGNRIEVTNNKFYKPLNDVNVEVKYVYGEYLPIPDTFLGKSVTVIVIGLILIGLGFYTINYINVEEK